MLALKVKGLENEQIHLPEFFHFCQQYGNICSLILGKPLCQSLNNINSLLSCDGILEMGIKGKNLNDYSVARILLLAYFRGVIRNYQYSCWLMLYNFLKCIDGSYKSFLLYNHIVMGKYILGWILFSYVSWCNHVVRVEVGPLSACHASNSSVTNLQVRFTGLEWFGFCRNVQFPNCCSVKHILKS